MVRSERKTERIPEDVPFEGGEKNRFAANPARGERGAMPSRILFKKGGANFSGFSASRRRDRAQISKGKIVLSHGEEESPATTTLRRGKGGDFLCQSGGAKGKERERTVRGGNTPPQKKNPPASPGIVRDLEKEELSNLAVPRTSLSKAKKGKRVDASREKVLTCAKEEKGGNREESKATSPREK